MKHRLFACIVPHGGAERLASAANAAGAGGGTVATARGTAPSERLPKRAHNLRRRDAHLRKCGISLVLKIAGQLYVDLCSGDGHVGTCFLYGKESVAQPSCAPIQRVFTKPARF